MAEKIKNLLFDLGGVVCDIDIAEGVQALENLGIKDVTSTLNRYKQYGVFHDFECGVIDTTQFCAQLRELSGKPYLGDNQIMNAWNSIVVGFPQERLKRLRELKRTYKMFLLSNTNPSHYDYFPSLMGFYKFDDLFDTLYLSYKMGLCKPERRIFEMVLEQENIKPEETLFIDDSELNIKQAAEMGFKTFLVREPSDWLKLEL